MFEQIQSITQNSWLITAVLAITIFVAGLILGKILGKTAEKILKNLQVNELVAKTTRFEAKIDVIVGAIIAYIIYFFGFIMALNQLGVTTTVLNLLSGAILALILIVVFLGVKDFIPNMTAGLFILSKGYFTKGDTIQIHEIKGTITEINLVETKIITEKKDVIFIPNSRLTRYEVIKKKANSKKK
jgi:small conductance mechanosensitive channel